MRLQHLTTTIEIPQIVLSLLLVISAAVVNGQRVAPGIPPQQYQHVPVQQQQHPPPPQYQQQQQQQQMHHAPGVAPQHYQPQQQQQPNVQYQQVPVQQQQQQPPQHQQQQQYAQQAPQVQQQQQQPQQQQHPQPQQQHAQHHAHGQPQQVLNAANMEHERAHIQEHMQVPIDTSKMSEAELQFHYFKMHDSDNNNKLDGCELIKSLIHWHVDDHGSVKTDPAASAAADEGTGKKNGTIYSDKNLEDVIDYVLQTMDLNHDGYVDYAEYRKSDETENKTKVPAE